MGLALYGKIHHDQDQFIPSFKGTFKGFITDYSEQLQRAPDSSLRLKIEPCMNKKDIYQPYYLRIAYLLQQETQRCLQYLVQQAIAATGIPRLCFAGGVALNCVANNYIQNMDEVNDFFIQPASGDTGIAIGLSLFGAQHLSNNYPSIINNPSIIEKLQTPFSCDTSPMAHLITPAKKTIFQKNKLTTYPFQANYIAKYLSQGLIVSFFQNGIELGPRALGNRSFLADPRRSTMKDVMNSKIKHREKYRPFAPMILSEHFKDYFISPTSQHPFMLQAPYCTEKTQIDDQPSFMKIIQLEFRLFLLKMGESGKYLMLFIH